MDPLPYSLPTLQRRPPTSSLTLVTVDVLKEGFVASAPLSDNKSAVVTLSSDRVASGLNAIGHVGSSCLDALEEGHNNLIETFSSNRPDSNTEVIITNASSVNFTPIPTPHSRGRGRPKGSKNKNYNCKHCSFTTRLLGDFKTHQISVHPHLFTISCKDCDCVFERRKQLTYHRRSHHICALPVNFKCTQCDFKCKQKYELENHMQQEHSKESDESNPVTISRKFHKPYPIPSCIKIHKKKKLSKPYGCDQCDYKCTTFLHLKIHFAKHSKDGTIYKCEQCKFTAVEEDVLQAHFVQSHNGGSINENLQTHKKSCVNPEEEETIKFLFKCSRCPYHAKSEQDFTTHRRQHVEKVNVAGAPWSCDQCPFLAPTLTDLKIHMGTHGDEMIYKCQICPFSTSLRDRIATHNITMHGDSQMDGLSPGGDRSAGGGGVLGTSGDLRTVSGDLRTASGDLRTASDLIPERALILLRPEETVPEALNCDDIVDVVNDNQQYWHSQREEMN